MRTIVLDAELRSTLNGLKERVAVCDEDGNVVGQFLPAEEYYRMLLKYQEIPFSEEQIEQFRKSGGGCTPEEFWKKLGRK